MSRRGGQIDDDRAADSDTVTTVRDTVDSGNDGPADLSERERLAGQLARLEAENERLRTAYAHTKQTQSRRTAFALVAVGVLASIGAVLFANARTVLFALGGTGVFLGVITYYLSPEQFLPASVGRSVYEAMARNQRRAIAELGLSQTRRYVPLDEGDDVRLYVPSEDDGAVPDDNALDELFVVTEEIRALAFHPTGLALFEEFEQARTDPLASTPSEVGTQLVDALAEQFELLASADPSASGTAETGQLTVGVVDSAYGFPDRFDHPVVSFFGVGLARAFEIPVEVTVQTADNRYDAIIVCRWQDGE